MPQSKHRVIVHAYLVGILLLATGIVQAKSKGGASTSPSTAPTTGPSTELRTGPTTGPAAEGRPGKPAPILPDEFSVFQKRSAFSTGGGPGAGAAAAGPQMGGPEAMFVLRGIVQMDSHFTALIENTNSKDVTFAAVGDSLASGKVKAIDLDSIQYDSGGNVRPITVGQNLMGQDAPPPPPASAPSGPPGGPPGADGQPPNGDQPPPGMTPDGKPPKPRKPPK